MRDYLRVGLIQPVLDSGTSWGPHPYELNMLSLTAERIWDEIKEGFRLMLKQDQRPSIILIPELHLPTSKISAIKRFTKKHGIMVIAGVDFQRNPVDGNKIRNRGIVTIPVGWGIKSSTFRINALHFGKSYFSYMERQMFNCLDGGGCCEDPEQNMYIFTSTEFGNFGLMICSDIFDIERMLLYQGRIHHLFIISLNKDLNTYFSMAEALTRMLYCNVVICNSGHYGGSLVVSPFEDPNDRTIYKYLGQKMFNTHVIDIPVHSLNEAQKFDFSKDKKLAGIRFKASPPGYKQEDLGATATIRRRKKKGL